jgi:hypothetical protein
MIQIVARVAGALASRVPKSYFGVASLAPVCNDDHIGVNHPPRYEGTVNASSERTTVFAVSDGCANSHWNTVSSSISSARFQHLCRESASAMVLRLRVSHPTLRWKMQRALHVVSDRPLDRTTVANRLSTVGLQPAIELLRRHLIEKVPISTI